MNQSEQNTGTLPMRAMKEVPEPKGGAVAVVALVKKQGRVSGYKLSDGRVVSKEEGVALARNGEISGVGISSRKGNEYLKSLPDGQEDNNLGNLPTVKE